MSPKGAALALLSAVTYAAFIIAGRKSSFAAMPSMEVIFFVCLFSSVIFGGRNLAASSLQDSIWLPAGHFPVLHRICPENAHLRNPCPGRVHLFHAEHAGACGQRNRRNAHFFRGFKYPYCNRMCSDRGGIDPDGQRRPEVTGYDRKQRAVTGSDRKRRAVTGSGRQQLPPAHSSGCCPSCAFHWHSVNCILENTA